MRLATWNVNSLKVRLPHLLDWLTQAAPDVVCLQETKLEDVAFPVAALAEQGWHVAFAGQKTYNGVAILARDPLEQVSRGIPGFDDPQQRVISATVRGVRIVCVYVPNGQAVDSDKYRYKLSWLAALENWLAGEVATHARLAVLGDYNIAPHDRDVYDPAAFADGILVSPAERAAFRRLLELGLVDSHPSADQTEPAFTWWDYRMASFRRNLGLRIDHILLTSELARHAFDWRVDRTPRRLERPSDHAPVLVDVAVDEGPAAI